MEVRKMRIQSRLVAENKYWRIRVRTDNGEEDYAITKATGRYSFYLHGRMEKIIFVKKLETLKQAYLDTGEKNWTMYFDSPVLSESGLDIEFAIGLSIEDIEFFLANIPLTESERQMKVEEEIIQSPSVSETLQ